MGGSESTTTFLYNLVDVELMLTSFSVGELRELIFNSYDYSCIHTISILLVR